MVIEPKFRTGGEAIATTLVFNDIAIGRGLMTLYLGDSDNGGLILAPDAFYSQPNFISVVNNSSNNFDIVVGKPLLVDGDCILELCLGVLAVQTGTITNTHTVTLFHVTAAAAETSLGSAAVALSSDGSISANTYQYFRKTVIFNVSNQLWKVGETIRLSIDVTDNTDANERALILACNFNEIALTPGVVLTDVTTIQTNRLSRISLPVKADI